MMVTARLVLLAQALLTVGTMVHASTFECQPGTASLNLASINLDTFPNLTACATTLKILDVSFNYITEIPPGAISSLSVLEYLNLNYNGLMSLPAEISSLWTLRNLWVNNNQLSDLPSAFGSLNNLMSLHLAGNRFFHIPSAVFTMWSLSDLDMSGNYLSHLPIELGGLYNMKEAQFQYNYGLTSVPAEYGKWYQLEKFYLWGSSVNCLPRSMKRLNDFDGNYLPACVNSTITGYVMHRSRNREFCNGPIRNISGIATGCVDYTRRTCVQTENEVTVVTDHLSDTSSGGLSCAPGATVLHSEHQVFPRCDADSGLATTCIKPEGNDGPYPHKQAGMVTLEFPSFDHCNRDFENLIFDRRLTEATTSDATTAPAPAAIAAPEVIKMNFASDMDAADPAAISVLGAASADAEKKPADFYRLHPDLPKFKVAAEARAKAAVADKMRMFREKFTAQNAAACDATTEVYFMDQPDFYDFSACGALRELTIYNGYNMSNLAAQVPYLMNLEMLSLLGVNGPVPDNLDQLPRLRNFTLWDAHLPDVVRRMPALTALYFRKSFPMMLPYWLGELTRLTTLDLNGPLTSWPTMVENLVHLEHFAMVNTWMGNSPSPAIGRFTKLRTLDLRWNYFSLLPASVGEMKQLQDLRLEGTQIQCLPQEVRELPLLRNNVGVQNFPACPAVPLPVEFSQMRNSGCLWDAYYGFWYRAICDGVSDQLTVVLYADSACRKQAKRKVQHSLSAHFPRLGYCVPSYKGMNATMVGYSIQYCHN